MIISAKSCIIYNDGQDVPPLVYCRFDTPREIEFGGPDEHEIIPESAHFELHHPSQADSIDAKLNISEAMGRQGLLLVIVREGHTLRELRFTRGLTTTTGYSDKSILFVFYNQGDPREVTVSGQVYRDKDNRELRTLKEAPRNMFVREGVLERAQAPIPKKRWIGIRIRDFARFAVANHALKMKQGLNATRIGTIVELLSEFETLNNWTPDQINNSAKHHTELYDPGVTVDELNKEIKNIEAAYVRDIL